MFSLFSPFRLSSQAKIAATTEEDELKNREDYFDGNEDNEENATPYKPKSKSVEGNHNKLTPVIFWEPGAIDYRDPLTEQQLNAYSRDFKARNVSGSFFYEPKAGTVLPAGTHVLTVTFVPDKIHKYGSVTVTKDIVVNKIKPKLSWSFPYEEILLGTLLGEEHFNVTSELEGGSFVFSHYRGMFLQIGKHTITAEYEPSELYKCNFTRSYISVVFHVVGTYVPIVWRIPFSAESYSYFTKHIEDLADAATGNFVVASPPRAKTPVAMASGERTGSRHGLKRNRRKEQPDPSTPTAAAAAAAAAESPGASSAPASPSRAFSPECKVIATVLPNAKRNSAIFEGAPIIYPDPLPSWLFKAEAVFFNGETQESEHVEGRFEYDPPEGTRLPAGTYEIALTFYPQNIAKYRATTATRTVTVLKSPVALDWPAPVGMTEGAVLDEHALTCVCVQGLPGTFTYDPPAGAALAEGQHTLQVRFDPEDCANYHPGCTTTPFLVRPKRQVQINWAEPPDIVHPFPLSILQLNASSRGMYRGRFEYSPPAGTVLDAGTHMLSVTFYPELPTVAVKTVQVPIVVHQGLSRLIWNTPEPLRDGQGLYDDSLNCKCSNLRGGTYIYDPPKGTTLSTGTYRVFCKYIPDNPNYLETETYVNIQVLPKAVRVQSKYYVA
jgi:large repetitive protein